jgi:hypothetical protein
MIGKIVEIFEETHEVQISDERNVINQYKWTPVMNEDFSRLSPFMWVEFIAVDGFITRIEASINPANRLATLTPDQRRQLAIILQSSMKVVSDQMVYSGGTIEDRMGVIKDEAYDLMLFIDSKTTKYLG